MLAGSKMLAEIDTELNRLREFLLDRDMRMLRLEGARRAAIVYQDGGFAAIGGSKAIVSAPQLDRCITTGRWPAWTAPWMGS